MTCAADTSETRLLTFQELATLLETAPKRIWLRIGNRTLLTSPHGRHFRAQDLREFIDLNEKLFGPGKNEL